MTVRELILALEKFPDDMPVLLQPYPENPTFYQGVGINKKLLHMKDRSVESTEYLILEPL